MATNQPRIISVGGEQDGTEFVLRPGENRIGRVAENEIVIRDRSISRRHAVIRLAGNQATIEDMGSHNGIEVEGTRVERSALANGMKFKLGDCHFIYLDAAGESAEPEAAPEETSDEEPEAEPSNLPAVQSKESLPAVAGNWRELFGDAESPPAGTHTKTANVDRVPAEDIFEEEKRPETTQAVEEPEEHRRRGLVLYVVSLLFVIIAGLYLLTRQSSSGVWNEETWDYLLKKNEQRVLHLRPYQTYRIDAEGENVVQLEPHKFNPKDEGERQVFLLVRAIGPGRARVDLVPSGQVLRFVVQGMIRPMEEDEAIAKLDQDQRLQMGRLLLRSGQKRPREEVANALADYSRAELILRPVKSRDLPLYNDVRRLQKETDQTIRREVENLKVQYYNSKKGDREVANAFLEKILELIPDKGDPQHQVVRLILDYRRANEK